MFAEELAPPAVWPKEAKDIFFDDARTVLSAEPVPNNVSVADSQADESIPDNSTTDWKSLIGEDTLTAEVKRATNRLAVIFNTRTAIHAFGHQEAAREFALLATAFSVIRQYPDNWKWKSSAATLESDCLRAADACVKGNDENQAVIEHALAQLEQLLRGEKLTITTPPDPTAFAEFACLMQSMETIFQKNVEANLASQRVFRKSSHDVEHSAQVLAMLSQVICREEYGYADEQEYRRHADELRTAAGQLREAARDQNFAKAVEAAARVSRSCAECHADYRG